MPHCPANRPDIISSMYNVCTIREASEAWSSGVPRFVKERAQHNANTNSTPPGGSQYSVHNKIRSRFEHGGDIQLNCAWSLLIAYTFRPEPMQSSSDLMVSP